MKVRRNRAFYEVYNLKDELIARGLAEDVATVMGCKKTSVGSSATTGIRMFGKYLVKPIGKRTVEVEVETPDQDEANKKIEKEILDNQLWNLKHNGNTIVTKDLDWHLNYFKENGFDCEARRTTHTNEKRRKECYYIVEVINARTERKSL